MCVGKREVAQRRTIIRRNNLQVYQCQSPLDDDNVFVKEPARRRYVRKTTYSECRRNFSSVGEVASGGAEHTLGKICLLPVHRLLNLPAKVLHSLAIGSKATGTHHCVPSRHLLLLGQKADVRDALFTFHRFNDCPLPAHPSPGQEGLQLGLSRMSSLGKNITSLHFLFAHAQCDYSMSY